VRTRLDNLKNQSTKDKNTKKSNAISNDYSMGQILVHNIPLFIMYVLGTILVAFLNIFVAFGYIIYIFIGLSLFMVNICVYCPHYGKQSSLCGYGIIVKRLAKRKNPREFQSNFKRFIAVLFPIWFIPLIVGIYLLIINFNWLVLGIFIIFIIIGFIIVPFYSRSKACKECKHRDQCPWMNL